MKTIFNCTPHEVKIVNPETKEVFKVYSKGDVIPRISQKVKKFGKIGNIPITANEFGDTRDLPKQQKDTFYIVSRMVKSANPYRDDLLVPNGIVRDEVGVIIGCTSLSIN